MLASVGKPEAIRPNLKMFGSVTLAPLITG